jgi:hypothetical protein
LRQSRVVRALFQPTTAGDKLTWRDKQQQAVRQEDR